MRKLAFLFACAFVTLPAQTELRHITGTVVDSGGKPIEKAIVFSRNYRTAETGPDGRFETDTPDSAVVIRKAGFQSERILTQSASAMRVTLRPADRPNLPACSPDSGSVGLEDTVADFRFPRITGVKYSDQGHDADYTSRSYYVGDRRTARGIMHGSGGMWSLGIPFDQDVLDSTEYRETVYPFRGLGGPMMIIDARGRLPDGTRWRFLGKFAETASYRNVNDETAQMPDRVLDGVCLK
ncbi:MAG TPA: carboxypeptidase-like regulatory domain-containing protein [Bryobacteraceae bacterium]|nr:carboxypeptidase-like regulatory domain-containing protein [Bryobacteraceae bacterium]